MAQCRNGHHVDPDQKFCRQCGAAISEDPAATTVRPAAVLIEPPLAPQPQPTPVAAPLPPQTAPHYEERHSNTVVYAIAGLVILVGVIGIAVALILGSGGTGNQRPSATNDNTGTSSTPSSGSSGSSSTPSTPSATAGSGNLPPNGVLCQGQVNGVNYGTFAGSPTSCQFAAAVQQAYVSSGKQQNTPLTATSPVTNKTYTNVVCVAEGQWVVCTSGSDPTNPARMFFAAQ